MIFDLISLLKLNCQFIFQPQLVMMSDNKVSLSHFEYEGHLERRFKEMLLDEEFTDVTLVCSDEIQIKAHRVVLSSSSSVFKNIFQKNPHQHPLLHLNGVKSGDMQNILQFIYSGQVEVEQVEVENFLKVATELKVYGLMKDIAVKQELFENRYTDAPKVNSSEIDSPEGVTEEHFDLIPEKYNCAMCNKEFESTIDLKNHVNTHKNMKDPKFKCEQCSKMFTTKGALDRHIKGLHEGMRYSCDKCEYNAAQAQSLKFHKINYHPVLV